MGKVVYNFLVFNVSVKVFLLETLSKQDYKKRNMKTSPCSLSKTSSILKKRLKQLLTAFDALYSQELT